MVRHVLARPLGPTRCEWSKVLRELAVDRRRGGCPRPNSAQVRSDGESACKRDSVVLAHRWPSICAAYPRGVDVAADRRAARPLCLTLLRVEFAEPCESPRTLVRSYRTVSPLPVTGCPAHRRSLSVALVRQVTPTWLSPAPCPEESRLSSTRSCRAAATRPTHHRSDECTARCGAAVRGAIRGRCPAECGPPTSPCRRRSPPAPRCRDRCRSNPTPTR